MNVLSAGIALFAVAVTLLVASLMVRAYLKYKGKRSVTCPQTGQPATVEVDARLAATSAVLGEPSLRLRACSRWPEHQDCGQECLEQIEATPGELHKFLGRLERVEKRLDDLERRK